MCVTPLRRLAVEHEAEGKLREIYEGDRKSLGYVPNHATVQLIENALRR